MDVVLATSMLQVGVDVSRLRADGRHRPAEEHGRVHPGVVAGRPDPADRPGLVVTLYNWTRPRDLAHYEDFEHYHATFYRQVEALSVTPYTDASLERGLTGVLDQRCAGPRRGERRLSRFRRMSVRATSSRITTCLDDLVDAISARAGLACSVDAGRRAGAQQAPPPSRRVEREGGQGGLDLREVARRPSTPSLC